MKKIITLLILTFAAITINAQVKLDDFGRIVLNTYLPDSIALPAEAKNLLITKLNQITSNNGMGGSQANPRFIITANVNVGTKDIIAGGQGAPLVPIGDFNLFQSQAESFLNIGGFANVSFKENGIIKAFDICPGNLPLNKLIESKGLTFDNNGEMARSGDINFFLLDLLNSLPFYVLTGPKSLGTEWLEEHFYPLLKFDKEIENNLRTVVEHIAFQIGNSLNSAKVESVMISGGGAKNKFLIERIAHYYNGKIVIPSEEIISFKEAIIFAFLGALYLHKIPNCIQSVTGASRATIGGTLHIPN